MAYDASKPENDSFMADAPGTIRGNMEGIRTGQIVDAGTLKGLSPGNGTGNIPISNGTMNTNLNAEKVGGKTASEFAAVNHTHAVVTTSTDGPMSSTDKIKLNGIAAGAEVNQNSFSNILVGSTTIQADAKTDTLEIVAGTNIALTPDATNDRVTIGVSGTVASAATCTGNSATATTAAACSGNAATATKLASAKSIAISGKVTGTATNFDGSGNITIPVTAVTADSCTGNAATATKWAASRTLTLTGDVTGSTTIDGSGNASIATTVTAGMPLGFTFAMLANAPPAGCLALQGALVSRTAYSDLWAWVQANAPLITEAAWQAQAAVQSSVGVYSSGDGSTTFRLPKIADFIRGSTTGRDPGAWQDDDLKSHIHTFNVYSGTQAAGGARGESTTSLGTAPTNATGGAETRPKSISMLWCVKAFGSAVNQGTVDITALATSINDKIGKADSGYHTKVWVSGEYTPVANTPTIVTHGLTIDPVKCKCDVLLKCVTAENGYSAGDYAINPIGYQTNAGYPLTPALNGSAIQINTGSSGLAMYNKASGVPTVANVANWRYIFRIWY